MRKFAVVLAVLVSIAVSCRGEDIYLKEGGVITGTITGSDTENLRIKVTYGEILVKQDRIIKIEYAKPVPEAPVKYEPEKPRLKNLSIGFQMDLIGYYSGLFICPTAKWWVTPEVALQFEYNAFELFGGGPTFVLKGHWGFFRDEIRYVSVAGGVVIMNTPAGVNAGFLGVLGIDVLREPSIPYAITAEIGYYYGPTNSYYYYYYGSTHNLWMSTGYSFYLF